MTKYKLTQTEGIKRDDGAFIPNDMQNTDYIEYQKWLLAGNEPEPADPKIIYPDFVEFDKPVQAPDFIVATPPIKDDPEEALLEAIAEMEKGQGNPKSVALIALSLAKYLKSKKNKLK